MYRSKNLTILISNAQVSEYQQYQDALAEDEFFDEDQVAWQILIFFCFAKKISKAVLTVVHKITFC